MNLFNTEEENINISNNYFNFFKQISDEFLKYLNNYRIASEEYLKKLEVSQEKFSPKLSEPKDQKNDKYIGHIITLCSIIPKIIEQQMINIDYFVEGINSKIEKFEQLIKEKNIEFIDCQNQFKEKKNILIKKYKDIENIKIKYMTNINFVEEAIHNFYKKKNNNKKENDKLCLSVNDIIDNKNNKKEIDLKSIEEEVNNSIKKTKKIEKEYQNNVKDFKKNFIDSTEETRLKLRNILCQISTSLKDLISNTMIFLQNSFKIPLSDIDSYLQQVIALDEYSEINSFVKSSYKVDNNLISINPEKYTLKFFNPKKDNLNKNNSNNLFDGLENTINSNSNNDPIFKIEDDLDYFQEEEIVLTIEKMIENFELLEKSNFNLEIEKEKLRCKYLTLKILSFAPENKSSSKKITLITKKEVEEMINLFKKKQNRIVFILKLSQFRTRGIFEIPEREYNILICLFNKIAEMVEIDEDYDSAINIIILSQTYYILKNNKKEYLQNQIMNNELFKKKKFWETFAKYSIDKEITLSKINDQKNGIFIINKKENELKYSNIAFSQLVPINNNMIEFGLDINIVEEIILPLIKKYKISPELSEVITSVINCKKLELQEKKDINSNKINNHEDINNIINNFEDKK